MDRAAEQTQAGSAVQETWQARVATLAPGDIVALIAGTRLGLLLLTYLGIVLIHDARIFGTKRVGFHHPLLAHWVQWDAVWYLGIARYGYTWMHRRYQSPTGFFPLYPGLIHGLVALSRLPTTLVALGLASACFAGGALLLYHLCRREWAEEEVAWRAVLYLTVFPTALFFLAPYAESLFLLLEVACFLALRRGAWGLAGLCGGLAVLTRPFGILLVAPFAWEYLARRHWRLRAVRLDAASVLLLPAALAGYMVGLARLSGDPLAVLHHQGDWQLGPEWPWQTLGDSLRALWTAPPDSFFQAHNLLELACLLFASALLVYGRRALPASYSVYTLAVLALALVTPAHTRVPLTSFSRHVAVLFPLFMALARLGRRRVLHTLYLCGAVALLALFTMVYVNGGWVD